MKITIIFSFILLASVAAYLRFYLASAITNIWSTTVVNVIGCLLIGALYSLKEAQVVDQKLWLVLSFAFLGALTTFSTYILDVFKLSQQKEFYLLTKYVLLTHAFAFVSCVVGYKLVSHYVDKTL